MQQPRHRRHITKSLARRILGWSLLALALLGFVLPVLPGLPLLALGIIALGPHDPTLRRIAVRVRLLIRRWSQMRQRHLRRCGIFVRQRYRETRLTLHAHLHRHEHGRQGWRAHLALLAMTLLGLTASAGAALAAWHTIP